MVYYRQLGNTGVKVSEIGMGCNRLGEDNVPDDHWVGLVHRAIELGVNLFDTSESYGWGHSEKMLGKAIGNRSDVLVATKISRIRETNAKDFSSARVIAQAEASLQRLQRDCIDIFQLHSPSLAEMQQFDWPVAMTKLKEQGKIRFVGVSINDAASAAWLIEQGLAQVLQVGYNMLEPAFGQKVFPMAEAHGVGIMIRVPMAQGILTGKFRPGQEVAADHRAHFAGKKMEQQIANAEHFRALAERSSMTFGQFALRYSISSPAVSATIPGARSVEQLEQNVAASNGKGLDASDLEAIDAIQAGWRQ